MEARYLERISMRRMVSPGDVAQMIGFLVSDAGRHIAGQSIAVDGNVETL
jgi:NAD(P)-dependent dehydrogenase (short-subunit alcohol dehydrogenase family)